MKNTNLSTRPVMINDIVEQANKIISQSDYEHSEFLQKVLAGWVETAQNNNSYTYGLYCKALEKNKALRKQIKQLKSA